MDTTTSNLFDTSDAVQDILSATNKQSSDGYLNANIFGLNLSRSQSAAPMFSSLSSSVSPPRSGRFTNPISSGGRSGSFGERSKRDFTVDTSDGGLEGGFLSGGEAQRIKLAAHLGKTTREKTLYIFDEPTTGLHFDDIIMLLDAFNALVENGHSVLVVEHNLDVIKAADWVLDLGPEGGVRGGLVVAEGTPEEVALVEESHTGRFLKKLLD